MVDWVLDRGGLERKDLDYCVFHQANEFMLEYVRKKCGLMDAPFHNDIEKIGNTVSDTVPFGLEDVLRKQASQMLRNVLLAGFGVGRMHCGSEQNDLKGESCRCLPYGKHARMERKAS